MNCDLNVQEKLPVAKPAEYLCITCADNAGEPFQGQWPPNPIAVEAVADANVVKDVDFSAMNKAEMVAFGAEHDIKLDRKMTRDQMISTLEATQKAE